MNKRLIFLSILLGCILVSGGLSVGKDSRRPGKPAPAGVRASIPKTSGDKDVAKSNDSGAWLQGMWIGTGYQGNTKSVWTISLYADVDNGRYAIDYPSLDCGGDLEVVSMDQHIAWFRERIKYGTDNCVTGGEIALTKINGKYITYTWIEDGNLGAWSTLTIAQGEE